VDITTVIGIFSGGALVFVAIFLGGGVGVFLNLRSVMITLGGTVAATLINYRLPDVIGLFTVVKKAFFHSSSSPPEMIRILVRFAEKARREGILSLEGEVEKVGDNFLKNGIQLAVDGTEPALIRDILSTEIAFLEERHKLGQNIFRSMGIYAPAFGMSGTLIGLIQMLRTLDDPSSIGPGMAVALITTFYGVLLSNLLFLPLAGKLKTRSEEEILIKQLIIEGIVSIQSGDNPRMVEDRLKVFLAPKLRKGTFRRLYGGVEDEREERQR